MLSLRSDPRSHRGRVSSRLFLGGISPQSVEFPQGPLLFPAVKTIFRDIPTVNLVSTGVPSNDSKKTVKTTFSTHINDVTVSRLSRSEYAIQIQITTPQVLVIFTLLLSQISDYLCSNFVNSNTQYTSYILRLDLIQNLIKQSLHT